MPNTMSFLKASFVSAVIVTCALPVTLNTAAAADYISGNQTRFVNNAGVCSEQSILKRVTSGFAYQNRHIPELPRNKINSVSDIALKRYEPAKHSPQITRTYCQATAQLDNNEQRQVYYMIEDGQGFASIGRNVEFCVEGYDLWHVYDAHCRVLR